MDVLAAVPVKAFGVAKARLAPAVDTAGRARLGKAIAARTVRAAAAAGAWAAVLTADPAVVRWAEREGLAVLADPGTGLDDAAAAAAAHAIASDAAWAIVHADLPTVSAADLAAVFAAVRPRRAVLAPSHDGGTTVLAAAVPLPFRYGPGSFHRHLAAAVRAGLEPVVVARPGTALDLDSPADLEHALTRPAGAWLWSVLGAGGAEEPPS
jgi:2-phospho-L-lactate guanylyltransferase